MLESYSCLRRWEIGDIASHIGQVYYHYYLRTSERSYLVESAVFYDAIQQRQYFHELSISTKVDEFRRVLRYHARFIMVLLLQHHFEKVLTLCSNLHTLVQRYVSIMAAPDAQDWLTVVRELRVFCRTCIPASLGCRIGPGDLPAAQALQSKALVLQHCVFVASQAHQVKFSELTLDFLRMMRSVEREETDQEPVVSRAALKSSTSISTIGWGSSTLAKNPQKHLLYRPSVGAVLSQLVNCAREISGRGALLLYVAADGFASVTQPDGLWTGGAVMSGGNTASTPAPSTSTNASRSSSSSASSSASFSNNNSGAHRNRSDPAVNTLCPGDVTPLLRHPLMLICEGDCAAHFANLSSPFGAPLVVLLAPEKNPLGMDQIRSSVVSPTFVSEQDDANKGGSESFGNLFTLFLTDPITAVVRLCKVGTSEWNETQISACREAVIAVLRQTLKQCASVPGWEPFCGDEFMALFVAKFVLCRALLSRHCDVPRLPEFWPRCVPALPQTTVEPRELLTSMLRIMNVSEQFDLS